MSPLNRTHADRDQPWAEYLAELSSDQLQKRLAHIVELISESRSERRRRGCRFTIDDLTFIGSQLKGEQLRREGKAVG